MPGLSEQTSPIWPKAKPRPSCPCARAATRSVISLDLSILCFSLELYFLAFEAFLLGLNLSFLLQINCLGFFSPL